MKSLVTILLVVILGNALAQDCTEHLFQANQLYKKGLLNEALTLAQPCSVSENATHQWKAYRMIALCQLALGNNKEAREAAGRMKELNPAYKPSANDPAELVKLLSSIKLLPTLTLGLTTVVGFNSNIPRIIQSHNAANYTKTYNGLESWQAGLTFGYHLNQNFSVHTGLMAINKRYGIEYTVEEKYEITVSERLTYLNIPFFLRFQSPLTKRFQGFVNAGTYWGGLAGANSDFVLTKKPADAANNGFSSYRLNSMERKNKVEYGLLTGIGVNTQINNASLLLEINYYRGIGYNVTNRDNRYKSEDLVLGYFYLDDDLRLDNVAVSLSYILNINYKVSKNN